MKLLNCPLNGLRNISEFACLGEVKPLPAPDATGSEWADYVFIERNLAGVIREWWIHTPTNFVFIADRDTRTEEILATYRVSEEPEDLARRRESSR